MSNLCRSDPITYSTRNPAIALNLPDTPEISDKIHEDLSLGRPADTTDVKTLNDLKLLQMGWAYDLNFSRTFELIHEKGYLEKLRDTLPRHSGRAAEIYTKANKHLQQNAGKLSDTLGYKNSFKGERHAQSNLLSHRQC